MTADRIVTTDDVSALGYRLAATAAAWAAELPTAPDDPEPPEPEEPSDVEAVAGDGVITVSWAPPTSGPAPIGWRFGRSGRDSSGSGAWMSGVLPASTRSARLDKLVNGQTYEVTVVAVHSLGLELAVTVQATPTGTIVVPPPNTGRRVPLIGRDLPSGLGSGLPVNSTVFLGVPPSLAQIKQFGTSRGRRIDGALTFPGRGSWAAMRDVTGVREILDAGGLVIFSIPHAQAPTNRDGSYTAEALGMNVRGANDGYRTEQRDLARWYTDQGLNRETCVFRLGWEYQGDWYAWSTKNGGPQAFRDAWRNCVANFRAGGLTKARFALCNNKGPSQTGHRVQDVWPGAEYCDVIGVDQYDQWMPARNPAQWAVEIMKDPALGTNIAFARQQGVMWSVDECGNTHGQGPAYGGDNPPYWDGLIGTVMAEAAEEDCAWWNTYNEKGTGGLSHDFTSNPQSYARYKQLLAAIP